MLNEPLLAFLKAILVHVMRDVGIISEVVNRLNNYFGSELTAERSNLKLMITTPKTDTYNFHIRISK